MTNLFDFWIFITNFGDINYWTLFSIFILIFYIFLQKKEKKKFSWLIFVLIPALFFSNQMTSLLKDFFKIQRPCLGESFCPQSYSFPSGHATVIAATMFSVFFSIRNWWMKIFPLILIGLVAFSRIALNLHTYFDVVGGIFIGFIFVFFLQTFYVKLVG